jgi:hypothetical protein
MTDREAFEKWLGTKPSGQAHYLAWEAWKAAKEQPPTHADLRCDCGAVWRWQNRKWSPLTTSKHCKL